MYKTNDQLWKGVIEEMFEDFVAFFIPNLFPHIDFSKGVVFLDKELEQIYSEDDDKLRLVDKLVKVFTLDGREHWVLIHVEVQGYYDPNFPERMYIYFVRLKEKYKKQISAIAIFSDRTKKYKPDVFEESYFGTEIRYKYLTYKVLDQNIKTLRSSNNPFSTVVEATLVALKNTKIDDLQLVDLKVDLVKRLVKKGFSKQKIFALMNFIRYYIRFKDDNTNPIFEYEIDELNKKTYPMGTQEILLHQAKTEGLEQGLEKGLEQGLEKGLEQGLEKGLEQGIEIGASENEQKKNLEFATALIISTDFDDAKIALLVGVTEEYVIDLRNELESQ